MYGIHVHSSRKEQVIYCDVWLGPRLDLWANNPIKHPHLRQGGRSKPPGHSFSGWSTVETTWQWEGGVKCRYVCNGRNAHRCGLCATILEVTASPAYRCAMAGGPIPCCERQQQNVVNAPPITKNAKQFLPDITEIEANQSDREGEGERERERGKGFGTDEDTTVRTGRVRHEDTVRVGYFHGCYIFSWAIREKFLFLLTFLIGNVPFPPPPGPSCLSRCCCCCCGRKDMDEGRSWLAGQTEGGKDD